MDQSKYDNYKIEVMYDIDDYPSINHWFWCILEYVGSYKDGLGGSWVNAGSGRASTAVFAFSQAYSKLQEIAGS